MKPLMLPVTVAVVDDDARLTERVRRLLDTTEGFLCVAVCPTAEAALEALPPLRPRVVLMDIQLPEASGVDCVRQLKPLLPGSEFLMLTVVDDYEAVYRSLAAGATGYLLKGTGPEELLEAIRELVAGGSPMSGVIARRVLAAFRQFVPPPSGGTALTSREREVLEALATGSQYKEVADTLGLTYHTVRTHVQNIYKKLQVHSRAEAVRRLGRHA